MIVTAYHVVAGWLAARPYVLVLAGVALVAGVGWAFHWWILDIRYWLRRRPEPEPEFDNGWREGMPVQYPDELVDAWDDQRRRGIDPVTGQPMKDWEQLDPDDQADQLIAEWHDVGRCLHCDAEVDHYLGCPDDPNPDYEAESHWWFDDPDLVVWDAKQQANRCWEILHLEFPRLRAELGLAAA